MENQCQHPLELQDTYIREHGLVVIDHVTSMPVYGEPYVSPHLVIGLNQRGWVKLEYDMNLSSFINMAYR